MVTSFDSDIHEQIIHFNIFIKRHTSDLEIHFRPLQSKMQSENYFLTSSVRDNQFKTRGIKSRSVKLFEGHLGSFLFDMSHQPPGNGFSWSIWLK